MKGRTEPVEVYELWDASIDLERAKKCREKYEAALELYFAGNWAAAVEQFQQAETFEPSQAFAPTTPSAVLAKRCQVFLESGGPENWDGAYRMQTK